VDEVAFGRYRLVALIGEGGMGKVYRAHDTVIGRDVAIKVLPIELGSEPGYRARFKREAQTAARLNEPHIIPIFDTGEFEDQLYLVMPIVEGVDVHALLAREGPMRPPRAVHVIEQLGAALDAAHAAGLVHRDVKPSNALVTARDFVYLIDFGIAHVGAATKLTATGMMVGTLAYMAPERFTSGVADARSDVYALACVLHECLTAQQPYPGDSLEQQIAGHLTLDPPRPSEHRSGLPGGFDEVIAAGMAKNPEQRFQSGQDLAVAARRALTSMPSHIPRTAPRINPTRPVPPPRWQQPPYPNPVGNQQHPPNRPAVQTPPQPSPSKPAQSRRTQIAALVAVVATLVILSVAVITFTLFKPHASQTPTAAPPSEPTTPGQTAAPASPSQPPVPTSQYFKTPWGTRCQVDTDTVTCDTCEPGLLIDTPHSSCPGAGSNQVAVNASGASLTPADGVILPATPTIQPLAAGQTYRANGWTIAVSAWVRFTNDATGHGMAVAAQNFDKF